MNIELYMAFILATTILVLIPGPAVSLIIANSIAHGARGGLITVAGSSTAIFMHLVVTAFGMTSLLLLLSAWFEWLRWAGVAYLVYLGVQQWRARPVALDPSNAPVVSDKRLYIQGFIVNATNPKTLFFYAAFFPQFVDSGLPLANQLVVLCMTFLVIATVLDGGYAVLGGRMRGLFNNVRRARIRNRITGSLLIGAGVGLALARRN